MNKRPQAVKRAISLPLNYDLFFIGCRTLAGLATVVAIAMWLFIDWDVFSFMKIIALNIMHSTIYDLKRKSEFCASRPPVYKPSSERKCYVV